jgi:hypothetical protein
MNNAVGDNVKAKIAKLMALGKDPSETIVNGQVGTALVLVQNKIQARDAEFGRMKTVRTGGRRFEDSAYSAGSSAGDRVGLNRPLEQNGQKRIGG